MAEEKIRITWDEINSPETDARLAAQQQPSAPAPFDGAQSGRVVVSAPADQSLWDRLADGYRWLFAAAAACAVAFILVVLYIAYLSHAYNAQREHLRADAERLVSTTERLCDPWTWIPSIGRSFFDGLTLGMFAEEGLLTEMNKAETKIAANEEAWDGLQRREAALESEHAQRIGIAAFVRNVMLLLGLGLVAAGWFFRREARLRSTAGSP